MRQNDESAETRAERYEALYKEQRITEQEYDLLRDEFLQQIVDPKPNNHNTNPGQPSPSQEDGAERTDRFPPEGVVRGANDRISIAITGLDYYNGTGETILGNEHQDGLFVSIEIASLGPDIRFRTHNVTVLDSDGYTHQAENSSEALHEINMDGLLNSPWQLHHVSGGANMNGDVPGGGKIKSLVHIPSTGMIEITEFKYQGRKGDEISIDLSVDHREQLQGLPDSVDEALRKIDYVQ
ncbi:hypothetical protein [Halorubrum sp. SY-15]|uniref:hypothetical protein n=1 Tax=Halorubrum sp. SY-15 TaxID=3402277 RepID=UPI003EC05448